MGRLNIVIRQVLRCTLSQINDTKNWLEVLPTVDLVINHFPNRSTGYSPFFPNYGYHPTVPADFLCGNEIATNETVVQFCKRMKSVWETPHENMKKAITLHAVTIINVTK